MRSDDIKKELDALRSKERILLEKYEKARIDEAENKEKEDYLQMLVNKQEEKHDISDAQIKRITCYFECPTFYCNYSNQALSFGGWDGFMFLYDDNWFEGYAWDIINIRDFEKSDVELKWTEPKLIYGLYNNDKYIELMKVSKNGMSDPFIFRNITTKDIQVDNSHHLDKGISVGYDFVGPIRHISCFETPFGASWIKIQEAQDKDEALSYISEIKDEEKNNVVNYLYRRMLAYKDSLNEELLKMYNSGDMMKLYYESDMNPSNDFVSPDNCYAIDKVLDEGYNIDYETAKKVCDFQYKKGFFVK